MATTMDDTEKRREEAIALHALGLGIGEIAAEMGVTYDRAYYLLDSAGIAVSKPHATPEGPAIGTCSVEARMRADAWSASDELLRRLRLYHPDGHGNVRPAVVGIFRGTPVPASMFIRLRHTEARD